MAHFYGTLQGQCGETSRLGSKASGLQVKAASWQGAIRVHLYEKDGVDYARIELATHQGAGTERTLYDGPVSGRAPKRARRVHGLAAINGAVLDRIS